MSLELTQKPTKMSFSITALAQSSCQKVDLDPNRDAVIFSRHWPVSPLTSKNEESLTPVKLQSCFQPLTSTPISSLVSSISRHPKRKRSDDDSLYSDNSCHYSASSSSGTDSTDSTSEDTERPSKKSRCMFTNRQIIELEKYYIKHKYLLIEDRPELAKRLGLRQQQVKTWFQNRRMKDKRLAKNGPSSQMQKMCELVHSAKSVPTGVPTSQGLTVPDSYMFLGAHYDAMSYMYSFGQMSPVFNPAPIRQPYTGLSPRPADFNRM